MFVTSTGWGIISWGGKPGPVKFNGASLLSLDEETELNKVEIKDADGSTIISFTTENSYAGIVVSTADIKQGNTYTLYINGNEKSSQEQTSTVTSQLSGEGMMGGGRMIQGGQMQGGMGH